MLVKVAKSTYVNPQSVVAVTVTPTGRQITVWLNTAQGGNIFTGGMNTSIILTPISDGDAEEHARKIVETINGATK